MSDKWIRDTGQILILASVALGIRGDDFFLWLAIFFIGLSVLLPGAFRPIAYIWLKLVKIINIFMPKIFFGLVFFVIILPVGLTRRIFRGDTLTITNWKTVSTTFRKRNYRFSSIDLEKPY